MLCRCSPLILYYCFKPPVQNYGGFDNVCNFTFHGWLNEIALSNLYAWNLQFPVLLKC